MSATATTPQGLDGPGAAAPETPTPLGSALRGLLRKPSVLLSAGWLIALSLATALAGPLSPEDPYTQNLAQRESLPSAAHLLGTDGLGRDLLSRILHGGGGILATSLETVVIALLISLPLGLIAGYAGGWFDSFSGFLVDVLYAVPAFVILVAVAFISENNLVLVMGVLGVLGSTGLVRLIRGSTQSVRDQLYVDAARVSGLSRRRIIYRHILPAIAGPLVVQAFLLFSFAFVIVTSLSFLGLGFSPESPSWGQMVFEATQRLSNEPWLMVPIGTVLIVTVLAINQIGSAVRDALPQAARASLLVSDTQTRPRGLPPAPTTAVAPSPLPVDADTLLVVDDLTVSFPRAGREQPVVDRVSFTVRRGETLGIVGESGCGKTMTSLAILQLVADPGRISGGRIMFEGQDLLELTERQRRRLRGAKIAMVSQEPMVALDPCFTVGSVLGELLKLHRGLGRRDARAEAISLLRLVGIADPEGILRRFPHQLSGGMAQRVAIAIALTGEPDLLIADEPTSALDVTIQSEILDLLRSVQAQLGTTIILVTHDLGVVADICERVAVMYAGQVVEVGAAADILLDPSHPYTRGLIEATPEGSPDRGGALPTIAGSVPLPENWPSHCRFADRCPYVVDDCLAGPVSLERVGGTHASRCVRAEKFAAEPLP